MNKINVLISAKSVKWAQQDCPVAEQPRPLHHYAFPVPKAKRLNDESIGTNRPELPRSSSYTCNFLG